MSVKMADGDSDIPPLEDMTDVLRQAEAIRQQLDGKKEVNVNKARAKVTKKHPTAHSVSLTHSQGKKSSPQQAPDEQKPVPDISESHSRRREAPPSEPSVGTKVNKATPGLFGGMKKGFLFGSPSKSSSKPSPSSSQTGKSNVPVNANTTTSGKNAKSSNCDEIPYITPTGKTESDLSFDEVQQAMSEAKGLVDNQDWVTDDLLSKIEKNEYLLKRFSDKHFMTALQDFQTDPQAAMAKYKGNEEVETFLTQFCGLLGDHFTKLGGTEATPAKSPASDQKVVPKGKDYPGKPQSKIVEICDDGHTDDTQKSNSSLTSEPEAHPSSPLDNLTNVNKVKSKPSQGQVIMTQNEDHRPDMDEVKSLPDKEVADILNDPKVMETLMDPHVMTLIQTLKDDPVKGQRLVDEAKPDLKGKIRFLVSKGLLQFQTH